MTHDYFYCHEWTPELQTVAEELIAKLNDVVPELEVLFMGAGALKLPGKNDIDLDILCDAHDLKRYVPILLSVLGPPQKLNQSMVIWDHEYKGFEIDAILSDPNAFNSHVPTQKRRFQKLKANPALKEQYRQFKLECNGLPYGQYEAKKNTFLEEVVDCYDEFMDQEVVDIIDESCKVLRQELKTEAHKHGWLHKTVIGYVKYEDDWALVRQASDRQDAGQLVAPVGGHVSAGESDLDALLRESEEEIGTRNITYTYVGSAIFHRRVIGRDENHLFIVYEIATKDPINLNHEAVAIERFSREELKRALIEQPENFGAAYYFVLEHFYPDYLPADYVKVYS